MRGTQGTNESHGYILINELMEGKEFLLGQGIELG